MGVEAVALLGGTTCAALTVGALASSDNPRLRRCSAALTVAIIVGFPTALLWLTSRGIHLSFTGSAGTLDNDWLTFGSIFSAAWGAATLVVASRRQNRLRRIVPMVFVGVLLAIGLAVSYGWEVRDANAYVTTAALPELRNADLSADAEAIDVVVPSEFDFERDHGRPAIITDTEWRTSFNDVARQTGLVRPIDPTLLTRRQLVADIIGFGLAAAIWLASLLPWRRWTQGFDNAHVVLAGAFVAVVAAGIPAAIGGGLPAAVKLGAASVAVFELVKVLAIVTLAVCLTRREWARPHGTASVVVMAIAVAGLAMLDLGAGITVAVIGLVMATLAMGRRARWTLLGLALVVPLLAPLAASNGSSLLPGAAEERLLHWTEPWASHDRATVANLSRTAAADVETALGYRTEAVAWPSAVALIEQELLFRLTTGTDDATPPVIPTDTTDELLLVEAEQAWTELGGYQASTETRRTALEQNLTSYLDHLRRAETEALPIVQDHFQLQRALFALREAGPGGVGLGEGRPETIPTITEDLALIAWVEQTGLLGMAMVVLLLLALAAHAIGPVRKSTLLPALLLVGLGTQFALQALVNAGGIVGAVPFTGVPFPLISRSGTSAVAAGFAVGVLVAALELQGRRTSSTDAVRRRPGMVSGLTASFVVVGASYALLMVSGSRLITPGPLFASLDDIEEQHLVVPDQWAAAPYRTPLGPIVDQHGEVLLANAEMVAPRRAPDEQLGTSLSHILSRLDTTHGTQLRDPIDGQGVGPTLVTTIDADVQRALDAAFDAGIADLVTEADDVRGAAVVLDAETGDIVAILSRPSFDLLELTDAGIWAEAEGEDRRDGFDSRFLNRPIDGAYPPGSTFKTITAAAAVEHDLHHPGDIDFVYVDGPSGPQEPDGLVHLDAWHQLPLIDGPPVTTSNHPHVDEWRFDIVTAFAYSCNVAFAEMAIELGPARLVEIAQRFGFERELDVAGLGSSTSSLDTEPDAEVVDRPLAQTTDALARTGFGQGEVLASPLFLATIAAAVANDGVIMAPRIVAGFADQNGDMVERHEPSVWHDTELSDATLDALRQSFSAAVTIGTAGAAQPGGSDGQHQDPAADLEVAFVDPDHHDGHNHHDHGNVDHHNGDLDGPVATGVEGEIVVGGKTGTAEWGEGGGAPHSLFIGIIEGTDARLAVAVIVEEGGAGGGPAARIFGDLAGSDAVETLVGGAVQ